MDDAQREMNTGLKIFYDVDASSHISKTPMNSNIPLLSKSSEKLVGFVVRNQDMIGLTFFCGICSLILRDPVQLLCSHRQCKSCVESSDGTYHPNPSCESCGDSFDSVNSLVLHQQNECDKKLVACSLKDFGCFEPIERVHMQDHYLSERHQNAIVGNIIINDTSGTELNRFSSMASMSMNTNDDIYILDNKLACLTKWAAEVETGSMVTDRGAFIYYYNGYMGMFVKS
ncbi:hypothetical protein I4U23_023076 [Adineta vaga]|nr:hypothetical protein I4U23_023076 [Adineta vaga]